MGKSLTKNRLFIVITIFAISVAVGIGVVFVYRQPNTSNLTANIASSELNDTVLSEVVGPEIDFQVAVENLGQIEPESVEQVPVREEPEVVSKPKTIKPAPSTETVTNIQPNPESNTKSKEATVLIVSPEPVMAGEEITVTFYDSSFENMSSVWLIDVYLESPSGIESAPRSIVNIDGEGRWFGSIIIPQDAELGTWSIKRVQIFDNTDGVTSYHYGTDIFTTFTVIAPQ